MAQIIRFVSNIVLMLLGFFLCISIVAGVYTKTQAEEYKADVIAEIENSNFNQTVIENCMTQAKEAGYEMQIRPCCYDVDGDATLAEVILAYSYQVPLLGISEKKELRGIAG